MLTFETLVPTAPKQRFSGISRTHTPEDVRRLRGSICIRKPRGRAS
jgi:isocitrate lyase